MEGNKQIFIGRAGNEPELKYTSNHKAVCNVSVAVDDKKDGTTIWKRVVIWGQQAEICPLYLKKGKKIFVEGIEKLREFKTDKGELKQYTEVIADNVGFLNI